MLRSGHSNRFLLSQGPIDKSVPLPQAQLVLIALDLIEVQNRKLGYPPSPLPLSCFTTEPLTSSAPERGETHLSSLSLIQSLSTHRQRREAVTHPNCKVVHAVHLQVLSYLQVFHLCFIPVRRRRDAVRGAK